MASQDAQDEFEYTCTAETSVYWTSTPGPYPICPGWSEDYACIADLDRGKCRDGPGDLCDCDAGRLFCAEGVNLCQPTCPAFVQGVDSIEPGGRARPIGCEKDGGYGLGTSRAYNDLSCCSSDAVYLMNRRQWTDGFWFGAPIGAIPGRASLCGLYAQAMAFTICDPNLGDYVRNHTLRVCSSSCEALYEACGPPGDGLPASLGYADAAGLCAEAWGGTGAPASDSPCDDDPGGFACLSGIHRVEAAAADGDCLALVPPTPNEIDHHLHGAPLESVCPSTREGTSVVQRLYWPVIVPLAVLGYVAKVWYRKRGGCGKEPAGQDDNAPEDAAAPGAPQMTPSSPAASVPVATAVPIGSAAAAGAPAPQATPALAAVAAASVTTQEGSTTAGAGADAQKDSEDPDLTFDQRMDLRFLEGKLQMEMITPEEYEEKKREILSS